MTTKTCKTCKRNKSVDLFYTHKQMADGHLNICKKCTKKKAILRYKNEHEKIMEYEAKRRNDPKRKKKLLQYRRAARIKRPGVYKATTKVNNAVRDGRLIKKPCEVCGDIKVHGHHEDYRSPLKVIWLCEKHHREIHNF